MQDPMMLETPVDVLNYALTLEHLEYAFYRDGLEEFSADDFAAAGYAANVYEWFGIIRDHEVEHVDTHHPGDHRPRRRAGRGGRRTTSATPTWPASSASPRCWRTPACSAYQGAAQFLIDEDELLTAALTIHGVEARHAAYLNGLHRRVALPGRGQPDADPGRGARDRGAVHRIVGGSCPQPWAIPPRLPEQPSPQPLSHVRMGEGLPGSREDPCTAT